MGLEGIVGGHRAMLQGRRVREPPPVPLLKKRRGVEVERARGTAVPRARSLSVRRSARSTWRH